MRKPTYKVESLISTKRETEESIAEYFKELGFQVFFKYASKIRNGRISSNEQIRSLFKAYDSGYPDLLLRKDKEISFIEIKLDGDSLRQNQVLFLDKLGKIENVTVLYINNINKELDVVKFETPSDSILRVDIRKRISSLKKLVKKRHYKPLWIIATLYSKYGDKLLEKETLAEVASRTKIDSNKITWFIDTIKKEQVQSDQLEPDQIEEKIGDHYTSRRLENIRKRKERILFKKGITEFPDWAEELTVKELIEKLKETNVI